MAKAGTLLPWAYAVAAGAWGKVPEKPEEGFRRPDCVPFAATLAVAAAVLVVLRGTVA
jgi:hypothetical protein